jgi:hypothetical protein
MDVEHSTQTDVSMEGLGPSFIDFQYFVDEILQLSNEQVFNQVSPMGRTTTHVSNSS